MLARGAGVTRDMSDLKAVWLDLRAHVDQLAGERQQYLDFFEQSPEAYLVTDAQGTIAEANGAAVDILQRRKQHLRGKPFAVFVAAESRNEVTLTARLIDRPEGVGGICWRLEAVQ